MNVDVVGLDVAMDCRYGKVDNILTSNNPAAQHTAFGYQRECNVFSIPNLSPPFAPPNPAFPNLLLSSIRDPIRDQLEPIIHPRTATPS
jgi:hypothetical protein